jgi:hypothetical protein
MAPRTDIYIPELFETFEFSAMQRQELSRSANGVTRGKDLGEALWRLSFTTRPILSSDAMEYEAKLRSLNGVIGTFLAGDPARCNPRAHKDGMFEDDAAVDDVGDDNKSLKLAGLDPGFKLSIGDYLSTPGYALHQVMEDAVADGAGVTPFFEVFPHIRPGTFSDSPATTVTLKRPQAEFILEPGSISRRRLNGPYWSVSFAGIQVIG